MAIVRHLDPAVLDRDAPHKDVDCTYSFFTDAEGNRYLQLDTYGSKERKMPGKKSQSIRFAPEAIRQLKDILNDF
jgi:hypothetical protein